MSGSLSGLASTRLCVRACTSAVVRVQISMAPYLFAAWAGGGKPSDSGISA